MNNIKDNILFYANMVGLITNHYGIEIISSSFNIHHSFNEYKFKIVINENYSIYYDNDEDIFSLKNSIKTEFESKSLDEVIQYYKNLLLMKEGVKE